MARKAIQSDFRTSKMVAEKPKKNYRSEMARIAIEIEFRKPKTADRSEIARNAIESEFRTSKMADVSHFVKKFKKKVAYRSEMARNEIESDFRTSKKTTPAAILYKRQPFCQKFQKNKKFRIDLKWPEMRSKVNFGHPKWPPGAIL